MNPLSRHGALVLLLLTAAIDASPQTPQRQAAVDEVRLTLSSQTVWQGETGWCSLSVYIGQQSGGLSDKCGGAGVFGTSDPGRGGGGVRQRSLTDAERVSLRTLYEQARLFDGGHVGADYSASDMPFLILIVRPIKGEQRAVVLVVTGNPTFSTGARKALLDWLLRERQALTKRQ